MDCVSFWTWLGSGVVIVPLLALLKQLPKIGQLVERWAMFIAPLLAALVSVIAAEATPYCAKIDPLLWTAAFAGLTYLVSQVLYWLFKKTGVNV